MRRHEAELGAERPRQHSGETEDGAVDGRKRTLQQETMNPAIRWPRVPVMRHLMPLHQGLMGTAPT
jgi:hypothetical protein